MPPAKRKRPERQPSEDDGANRPSPYKPDKSRLSRQASHEQVISQNENSSYEQEGNRPNGTPQATISSNHEASQTFAVANAARTLDANGSASSAAGGDGIQEAPPYPYQYVTDEIISAWDGTGGRTVADSAANLDELQLTSLFLELIRSALESRLSSKQAGLSVRHIIAIRQNDDDVTAMFLDTFMMLYEAKPKGPALRPLLAATGIDQQKMREIIDLPAVSELGLVRSTFDRMRNRKTTNALYRQANFNLLREESEGYSKLITEFFNTAHDASAGRDDGAFTSENAVQRVKALIGAFDLDVGRVLDIIFDLSANLLVKAYPFLVKFYRASSWWPGSGLLEDIRWNDSGFVTLPAWAHPGSGRWSRSDEERELLTQLRLTRDAEFWGRVRDVGMDAFFEIGARRIVDYDSVAAQLEKESSAESNKGQEANSSKRLRLDQDRSYLLETRCLPPSGNYDAAQLLGFKLRFYASLARDSDDHIESNLPGLVALLIKIGFVSLRDLYPHLHPPDSDMDTVEKTRLQKEKAEKEASERPGGGTNALAAAGALTDDTVSVPRRVDKEKSGAATPAQVKKDETKEELQPPQNQKILILKHLLLIGALPEALHILGRFPWLPELDHTLPPLLTRIARHMLSKLAEAVEPLSGRDGLRSAGTQLLETISRSDGTLLFGPRPPRRATRWLRAEGYSDGAEMRYYYPDWTDNIPVCQDVDDVFQLCDTLLGYVGAKIGQDVVLYGTLLRIATHSLTTDTSESNRSRWYSLMKRLLVPALSCSKHNPQLAMQAHELLSFFPTSSRYNIYVEWFTGRTSRLPDIAAAFARNRAEAKDVLRRVSNDTVKKQSRALGRVALASPGIVMREMIGQLESYSNMIPSLVDCTRYFSPLALDVLNWSLLNSLSGTGRDRMQADGMLTSPWLQALAQFVASLFAKYTTISLSPILQYLASELRVGNSTDLELLEQVLAEMAGIRSDVEFNDHQVLAMAGGQVLQTHILSQLSDTRHVKQKEAGRLMKALAGPGLTGQILVAITQERQMYAHHEGSRYMPLKVLGNNLDKVQAIFQQYLEVLATNLDAPRFEAVVPNVFDLIKKFGIEPALALTIHRKFLRNRMDEIDNAKKREQDARKSMSKRASVTGGDVLMKDAMAAVKAADEAPSTSGGDSAIAVQEDNDPMAGVENHVSSTGTSDASHNPWHPILEPVINQIREAQPHLATRVSVAFYVTFWTYTLQDVFMPMEAYQQEIKKVESQIAEINSDRSDVSAAANKERDRKKRALGDLCDKLKREPTPHLRVYMTIRERLVGANNDKTSEKMYWFSKADRKAEIDAKHLGLLQECFLPRALMSSVDAQYSFQMLKILHDNGTPGFSLMHLLNQLFKKQQLPALIFQCTANEAQHFGRFLCELLKHLKSWHEAKAAYDKEALGEKKRLPGFVKAFDANGEPKSVLDYEEFRRMLYNFHAWLSHALLTCFESNEYMHIRNGVIVLKAISSVFPVVKFMGQNMVTHVTRISKEDSRQDLKLAATSLLGPLKSREKEWILPQAFRLNDPAKDNAKTGSRGPSARPETPDGGAKLDATAPEFKPASAIATKGPVRKQSVPSGGPEDGEIEDDKTISTKAGDIGVSSALPKMGSKESMSSGEKRASQSADQDSSSSKSRIDISASARNTTEADFKAPISGPTQSHAPSVASTPQRTDEADPPIVQSAPRPLPHDTAARQESGPLKAPAASFPSRSTSRQSGRGDEQYGRLDRPSDAGLGSREHSPGPRTHTRMPAMTHRGHRDERTFERPSDRTSFDHRTRDDSTFHPRRDGQGPQRPPDIRDRPVLASHAPEIRSQVDRTNQIQSVAVAAEAVQPPPATSSGGEQPTPINPARLALINDSVPPTQPERGREFPHGGKDAWREREMPPEERASTFSLPRPDVRPGARGSMESPREATTRSQQPLQQQPPPQQDLAPTGPRRGRLQEESNYGRLNGPQDLSVASRPFNSPATRGGRNFTAPVGTGGHDVPSLPGAVGRLPETPAAFRGPAQQGSITGTQVERNFAPSSNPGTPSAESTSQVHPSRAAQLGQSHPPPIQTSFSTPNGPRSIASPINPPPSGPRGPSRAGPPSGTPTGPSPAVNTPPSGPATPAERQRRDGQRQRAAINATLQGSTNGSTAGAQGVQFKGQASRNSSASFTTPVSRSSVPTVASSMEPPQARAPFEARATGADSNFGQTNGRTDLFQGRIERNDENSRQRGEEDRPSRPHISRNPSREPRPETNEAHFRTPHSGPEDARDRRGPPRDDHHGWEERPQFGQMRRDTQPRDIRLQDRQMRGQSSDVMGNFSQPTGPPPSSMGEWDRNHDGRSVRRDGQDETRRGGRGGSFSFRGGHARHDSERWDASRGGMQDERTPDGRKRRHEDQPFDPTKRQRGGR